MIDFKFLVAYQCRMEPVCMNYLANSHMTAAWSSAGTQQMLVECDKLLPSKKSRFFPPQLALQVANKGLTLYRSFWAGNVYIRNLLSSL